MDSKSFSVKIKATKELLESDNAQLPGSCLEFTKESIGYLNTIAASAAQHKTASSAGDKVVLEWYPVFVKSLHVLHECRREKDVNLEIVLSHINHVLIHLVHFKDVPMGWFHCLGLINLEFLHAYRQSPSHRPDYLSSLVQKSHQCMRILAQRASGDKSKNNDGSYFKLLVIGCSYLTLESPIVDQQQQQKPQQDSLNICKGYVSNFLQLFCQSGENSGFVSEAVGETAKELFKLCCMFYCLCGPMTTLCPQAGKDACFFKELFRLVQHFPPFRDKMMRCDGDFSSLVADIDANIMPDGFSLNDADTSMKKNGENLHAHLSGNEAFQFAVSTCRVVHSLMQKSEGQVSKDYENQLMSDLDASVNHLHSIFADHPSPSTRLPQYVGDIVSVLSNSVVNASSSFKTLSPTTGAAIHDLSSLSLDALIRDVICYSGSPSSELSSSVASMVSRRSYDMAVVSKSRMALLQSLLLQKDSDKAAQVRVSGRVKGSLNLLCILVKKVKKGSGLSPDSSAYRTVFKTLKNAVSSLGSLCRLLRRSEKYDVIITVVGPLWPVANLPEMLSHVSYHESLCEAHRVAGDVQAACQVVVQAAALGSHLVTHGLLKSVLKIAKVEASLKIPVLFSKCSEEVGVSILMSLVRLVSASSFGSQTMTKHQKTILTHLLDCAHPSMNTSDKVLVKLLLAEIYWYCPDVHKDQEGNHSEEPLDLLKDCGLESDDVSCNDFRAQGILLAAEIRHALACMKMNRTSGDEKLHNNNNNNKDTSNTEGKKGTSKKNRMASSIKGDYSHVTPENNSTSMPPPNALEAPEFSSSVFDTPVTHSSHHKGKAVKQRRGLVKGKGGGVGVSNKDGKKQRASSSYIFPIWEDSKSGVDESDKSTADGDNEYDENNDNGDVGMWEVDSTELMEAACKSLGLWKEWYQAACDDDALTSAMAATGTTTVTASSSCHSDKDGKSGNNLDTTAGAATTSDLAFRVDKSLTFLQHLISLAQAHDKPIMALDCLSHARDLASKVHKSIVAEHINSIQLSLLGQLGLVQQTSDEEGGSFHSAEGKGGQLENGEETGEPSLLVSMASYLFYTRKIRESIRIQKSALAQIESLREKEPLTPTLTLQLSELKCLMVECTRVVELQGVYQEEAMSGQHPLQVVGEALKYITSLKSYLLGKAEHVLVGKGASVDSWQMISCYLNTLYLAGRVFLQAGMVKSSRTYFLEGLKMAQSCQLSTWHALFTTSLADISINYTESVTDVSGYLKDISNTVPSCGQEECVDDLLDVSSVESVLASLSTVTDDTGLDPGSSSSLLSSSAPSCDHPETSPVDFSPKLSAFHVYRLWLEAEAALHSEPVDFPKAFQHLFNAKSYAASIVTTLPQLENFQRSAHSTTHCELLVVETSLRLARAYFCLLTKKLHQCGLYRNSCHSDKDVSGWSTDEIWRQGDVERIRLGLLNLLEAVVHRGKQLSFSYEGKVLVATAQLLKINSTFLTSTLSQNDRIDTGNEDVGGVCLQEGEVCKDTQDVWMDCDDDADDGYEASCIAEEVKDLKIEEEFWNEKHKKWMVDTSTTSTKSLPSSPTPLPCKRSPCLDKTNPTVVNSTNPSPSNSKSQQQQRHCATPVTKSSSQSSPTKRYSPSSEAEDAVIPPTPPKVPKDGNATTTTSSSDNISSKKCVQIKGVTTTTTPASFFSPVSRTAAKGKRGRGAKSSATMRTTTTASKVLDFVDADEMELQSGNDKENGGDVRLSSTQKPSKTETRRGRGRGRRKADDSAMGDNCGGKVNFSQEHLAEDEACNGDGGGKDSKRLELSPITDQLGKLSLCKKSLSPVKRKSGGCVVSETATLMSGIDEEVTHIEGSSDGGREDIGIVRGRGRRGRGGRGRATTGRSSVASRGKKCHVPSEECDANSIDLMDTGNEIKDSRLPRDDKTVEAGVVELDDSPKVKVKRKTTKSVVASKSSTANSDTSGRSTRRNTRRNPKATDQEHEEQRDGTPEEEGLPEVQRGDDNVHGGDQSFSSQRIHAFQPSPFHQFSSNNDSLILDELNTTPTSSSDFHDFDSSPLLKDSPTSPDNNGHISYNFDIFSTPLRELHLNSPIEIPRGRPQRKPVAEKQPQLKPSKMETSRGFGDDDSDQENTLPNRVSGSRLGKGSGKVSSAKSKLSLKKNSNAKRATTISILCDSDDANLKESESVSLGNDKDDEEVDLDDKNEIALRSEVEECKKWSTGITGLAKKGAKKTMERNGRRASDERILQQTRLKGRGALSKHASTSTRRPSGKTLSVSQSEEREQLLACPSIFSTDNSAMGDKLLEDAVESLRQLSAFPPSHVFNQLSKATAMMLLGSQSAHNKESQTRIAAHLSNSMHVTFQHMLNKNLVSKLRVKKSTTATVEEDGEELEEERAVMREVLDASLLQGPVEDVLSGCLKNIPQGWVVVQMAVVSLDLLQQRSAPCQVLITRMSSDSPPMTFRIPLDRWKDFSRAKRVLEASIIHKVEGMTPEKYWTYRYKNDQDMKNLLYFLQEKFLSGHKWLLTGRLKELTSNKQLAAILHRAAANLNNEIKQAGGDDMAMDLASLEAILEVLLLANEKDIQSLLDSVWPNQEVVCGCVKAAVLTLQKELVPLLKGGCRKGGKDEEEKKKKKQEEDKNKEEDEESLMDRGPVVLILDKQFSQISWESMPVLRSECISRVPSLAALQALLRLHQHRTDSVFRRGVGRRNVMAVIDPETNLENSVKLLQPQYEKYQGWKCQTQQALTVSALKEYLSQELYIYSGHGWGRQFVAGDELQMFRAKAVAIIMGCNSGRMEHGRLTDGHGPPLYFLLAGCPAVIGNLWVVTDKDIDKLTSRLCQAWMTSAGQRSLGRLLNEARHACKLVGLNGFAPVVYGLPIQMN